MGEERIDPMQWLSLAYKIARRFEKYKCRCLDYGDIEGEAILTLCRAARDFRGDRSKFQPFASMHIRNALLNLTGRMTYQIRIDWRVLKWTKDYRAGRLDEASLTTRGQGCLRAALLVIRARTVGEHMTKEGTLDFIGGRVGTPWGRLEREEVLAELERLPPRQRLAVRATLGLDGGQGGCRVAGHALGVAPETARKVYREGLAELRRRLGVDGAEINS